MSHKYGDLHPTKPGWRFSSYVRRTNGELREKWYSPDTWEKQYARSRDPAIKHADYLKHKPARVASAKRWKNNNLERANALRRAWHEENWEYRTWYSLKGSSGRKGIPFDLPKEFFYNIPSVCPILGIQMFRTPGKLTPNAPSVDKVIPALGYVLGNVAWISSRANGMKSDMSLEILEKLVAYVKSFHQKDTNV